MLIRARGPSGMLRVEVTDQATSKDLYQKVQEKLHTETPFVLARSKDGSDDISVANLTESLGQLGLKHGDMLYIIVKKDKSAEAEQPLSMDPADIALSKREGMVARQRDPLMCRHAAHQKCINCSDLEPFDPQVQVRDGVPIKYMSFHTYLRYLNSGSDRGKFTQLEDLRCTVLPGCTTHKPWPAGRCSKCQPGTIHLQYQKFRHLDYVSFETPDIIDRFIGYWRKSGHQRVGFLYGTYEPMDSWVPLGLQANVVAIYEPPQLSDENGFEFLDDPNADKVDQMAAALGLQKVGWIYTDLVQEESGVAHTRFVSDDNALLSAPEIMQAATFQNQHPNVVERKYNYSQKYGSKFVTVVVSGDENNQVSLNGFQASNQCMALVRDSVVLPSPHNCGEMIIKPSTDEQFVPDVFYREKDEYGNEVQKDAKVSFRVEYLTIRCECGAPKDRHDPTFTVPGKAFVIENRERIGEMQNMASLSQHFKQPGSFLAKMSDFHLQTYMATDDVFSGLKELLPVLYKAIKSKNEADALTWEHDQHWQTIALIMQEAVGHHAPATAASGGSSAAAGGDGENTAMWSCSACTFLNQAGRSSCEVCGSRR
eukprot:m.488302 g.488302  ORF g.488302 m.488302 type:complete len:596 (+) comp25702_c0_seq1:203-1990(+)